MHYGHLVMAESILHSMDADGMLFVPARNHPLKSDVSICNYEDRLKMMKLAIEGNSSFQIMEAPDSPYTIDLIDYLKHQFHQTEFFLVIGSDLIDEFNIWHKHDEIVDSIRIIIAARPRYKFGNFPKMLKTAEKIIVPQYDISSSEIRERIRAQMSIKYMVPRAVEKYIYEMRLYVEN